MRVLQSLAVVCLVVLPACTAGTGQQDDTEVQGVQVERDDTQLAGPSEAPEKAGGTERAEAPSSTPQITRRPAVPSPQPSPTRPPTASPQGSGASASAPATSTPAPPSAPAPAAPSPAPPRPAGAPGSTDTSSTSVERPAPTERPVEPLTSGPGWGYASLLPHEDGSGWTETSATPPQDRSGDSGYRAFTTVASSPVDGAPGQLDVGCPSWIAAAPDAGLRGSGTVTVELRAGDTVLASAVHEVAVDLGPSERDPDLPWGSNVRVDAADGAAVTCTVRISA